MSIVPADGESRPRTLDLGGVRPTGWVRWRPTDGSELIFLGSPEGSSNVNLYAIRPDDTGLRTIGAGSTGDATLFFWEPHLSPDGSTIGFSTWGPNDAGVSDAWAHLRDLDTGEDRLDEEYSTPRFSPDGSQVVGEAAAQLMTGPADGSAPAREIGPSFLAPNGSAAGDQTNRQDFDFSPDSSKVVLTVGSPAVTWIIDVATGQAVRTTEPISNFPSWQRLAS